MITIPGLLFPNKDDSSDINHYVADCKIATFRHVFILGLDFLAATIYERETVGNFLLLISSFHSSQVSLSSQAALAARLERAEDESAFYFLKMRSCAYKNIMAFLR